MMHGQQNIQWENNIKIDLMEEFVIVWAGFSRFVMCSREEMIKFVAKNVVKTLTILTPMGCGFVRTGVLCSGQLYTFWAQQVKLFLCKP